MMSSLTKLTNRDKLLLIDRYGNLVTVITIAKDRLLADCGSMEDVEAMKESAYRLYEYLQGLLETLSGRVNG